MSTSNIKTKIWDKEILPKIESSVSDVFVGIDESDLISLYKGVETKYNKAKLDYKKGHNEFLYGMFIVVFLPLSFLCLIFPFYFAWKKFKELKDNKHKLQDFVDEAKKNKLNIHNQITSSIDNLTILNKVKEILKYKHIGPITSALVQQINVNSMFDYSDLEIEQNPFNSSWGIFDENKIIVNLANQSHEIVQHTYTGSTTVSYTTTDSDGNTVYRSKIVYASFVHPKPIISTYKKSFVFLAGCNELEFSYEKEKGFFDRIKNRKLAKLENKEFDDNFCWSYNNEVQFRMIFTPLGQEIFLDETRISKKSYKVEDEDNIFKYGSFIGNHYCYNNMYNYHLSSTPSIQSFNLNADITYEDFKKDFLADIQKSCMDQYKAIKFMWSIPYLVSEDHSLILEDVLKPIIANDRNVFLPYYFLNELFGFKIKNADTSTYSNIYSSVDSKLASLDFIKADVGAKAYEIHKKVTYVTEYCYEANRSVSVPVYYDDYIRLDDTATIYYKVINNKQKTFINKFNLYSDDLNNNNDINELVQELETDGINLSIVDGYIAIFFPSEIILNANHVSIIQTIIDIIENNTSAE